MKRFLLLLSVFVAVAAAQNPATAVFPSATATDTTLGTLCNSAHSQLTAGILSTDTAIPVSSGAAFCSPGYVTIDSGTGSAETIKICSITTNTLNVCSGGRAVHGTAVAHSFSANVDGFLDANYFNQSFAEIKAVETFLGASGTNVVQTGGNYTNPSWIASLAWGKLTSVPSTFPPSAHTHTIADLTTVGDWSSKITSGTYSISITGNAGSASSASAVAWTNVTSKPAWTTGNSGTYLGLNQVGCGGSWQTQACDTAGRGYADHAALADSASSVTWANVAGHPTDLGSFSNGPGYITSAGSISGNAATATNAGNANTVAGLAVASGRNNAGNQIVRTDGNGYIQAGYINDNNGIENPTINSFVVQNGDGYFRYGSLDNVTRQMTNHFAKDANWTWYDPYISLPTGNVVWGVFAASSVAVNITFVQCWSDTGSATIQLRRSDNGDMLSSPLTCNGSSTTSVNGYSNIPTGYYVGMWITSGSAQRVNVAIQYTTTY